MESMPRIDSKQLLYRIAAPDDFTQIDMLLQEHFISQEPTDVALGLNRSTPDYGKKLTKKFLKFGVLPTKNLPKKSLDTFQKSASDKRPAETVVRDIALEKMCYYTDFRDLSSRVLLRSELKCTNCTEQETGYAKNKKRLANRQAIPAKPKAPVSLTSSKRLKLTLQANRLECRLMESKINEMKEEISRHSVSINSDLSHDILGLITKHGDTMSPFKKLFWQQQQIISSRNTKGIGITQ
eukprot:gene662-10368_t